LGIGWVKFKERVMGIKRLKTSKTGAFYKKYATRKHGVAFDMDNRYTLTGKQFTIDVSGGNQLVNAG
jgi:hypothetical protein